MHKILVVEDEIWMREGIKAVVHKYIPEFSISGIANDGDEAVNLLRKERYDVILLDIAMPKMDGLTMLGELRRMELKTPIVIISGHSEFHYARTALRYGVTDYLLKPLDRQELMKVLHQVRLQLEESPSCSTDQLYDKLPQIDQGSLLVEKMIELIQSDYMLDISLSGFADQAGFNSSYLSRLFKLQTGKGFIQYLTEVRIRQAKKLLRTEPLHIADISKKVGFWDEKHFSRTFKKTVGCTPAEYRKFAAVPSINAADK